MPATQSRRRAKKTGGVSNRHILAVVGVAVVAAAILIVLNSNLVRTGAVSQVDFSTGVTADGQPFKGAADAPLKIDLYSDFLCNHCAEFATTLGSIDEDYIKAGRLQVVFFNFAFLTPESTQSAIASLCAADQSPEDFWRYHNLLYGSRDGGMAAYRDNRLRGYARDIGLDTTKFDQCLASKATAAQVQADLNDGRARGVEGTPTWFLNGVKQVGAMSEPELRRLLDETLTQAQTGS